MSHCAVPEPRRTLFRSAAALSVALPLPSAVSPARSTTTTRHHAYSGTRCALDSDDDIYISTVAVDWAALEAKPIIARSPAVFKQPAATVATATAMRKEATAVGLPQRTLQAAVTAATPVKATAPTAMLVGPQASNVTTAHHDASRPLHFLVTCPGCQACLTTDTIALSGANTMTAPAALTHFAACVSATSTGSWRGWCGGPGGGPTTERRVHAVPRPSLVDESRITPRLTRHAMDLLTAPPPRLDVHSDGTVSHWSRTDGCVYELLFCVDCMPIPTLVGFRVVATTPDCTARAGDVFLLATVPSGHNAPHARNGPAPQDFAIPSTQLQAKPQQQQHQQPFTTTTHALHPPPPSPSLLQSRTAFDASVLPTAPSTPAMPRRSVPASSKLYGGVHSVTPRF